MSSNQITGNKMVEQICLTAISGTKGQGMGREYARRQTDKCFAEARARKLPVFANADPVLR